ncbi:MAG: cob(I)yrinic acid a,c-diamide adenosyltransferase [Lachnospiraceae bacterium]|nr:cob(I)yrinic acid a,c-diamide adenosyltransferase [Lachnospiraceae bacterium]
MKEPVQIYYGEGRGGSAAALGQTLRYASEGKRAVIIQFLKGKGNGDDYGILERLEPEIRLFRFEKSEKCFRELDEKEQAEETSNMRNALNYAKKVLSTGECELLVLDEVLGLLDEGIATEDELIQVLNAKSDSTAIILTGWHLSEEIRKHADTVYKIDAE